MYSHTTSIFRAKVYQLSAQVQIQIQIRTRVRALRLVESRVAARRTHASRMHPSCLLPSSLLSFLHVNEFAYVFMNTHILTSKTSSSRYGVPNPSHSASFPEEDRAIEGMTSTPRDSAAERSRYIDSPRGRQPLAGRLRRDGRRDATGRARRARLLERFHADTRERNVE